MATNRVMAEKLFGKLDNFGCVRHFGVKFVCYFGTPTKMQEHASYQLESTGVSVWPGAISTAVKRPKRFSFYYGAEQHELKFGLGFSSFLYYYFFFVTILHAN